MLAGKHYSLFMTNATTTPIRLIWTVDAYGQTIAATFEISAEGVCFLLKDRGLQVGRFRTIGGAKRSAAARARWEYLNLGGGR